MGDDFLKAFGDEIRRLRCHNVLSIAGLAEKSGCSTGYIELIEKGSCNPNLKTILALSYALDHRLQVLFESVEKTI